MERSNENIIEWLTGEKEVELTLNQQKYINKARKLKADNPEKVLLIENTDGSVFAKVPLSWIKISPPRKVNLTEEEREARRQIMKAVRELQKSTAETLTI